MNEVRTKRGHRSPDELSRLFFGGNRESTIQRDGEKCVKCGMTRQAHREKYGMDITVDHIDGNGLHKPKHEKNNDPSNLQTLCLPCHSMKDNVRISHIKLTFEDAQDIRMFAANGMKLRQIREGYRMVSQWAVKDVLQGRTWKVLTPYVVQGETTND